MLDREPAEPMLRLPAEIARAMRADLPRLAEKVVAAIVSGVPTYAVPFEGKMGRTIIEAVQLALGGFLELAASPDGVATGVSVDPVRDAAYALGRGEARSGRSLDALAAAYRVGARTAWRDLSAAAVAGGLPAATLARFAEAVFDYIDQLSDASVAGHADELATTGRVKQRLLDRLGRALLAGAAQAQLDEAAERADWAPPRTLTAVVLAESKARSAVALLDGRTLQPTDELPGLERHDLRVLLVPDAEGRSRPPLLRMLAGLGAVVGPARPWTAAEASFARVLRVISLDPPADGDPVDTEAHLAELVLGADAEARADLREQVLAPISDQRPPVAEKLTQTLRSWLLHHGRREDVAKDLFVHPQTVRYRMGQLRELYGDALEDPETVRRLTVALA